MNYDYCDGMIYTIKKGDTLYSISRSKQVPLSMLLRANPYVDVYNLQVGDTICIPMRRKPCCGRSGANMQNTQGMAGVSEAKANIEVISDEGEAVTDSPSESEIMEFNETDEIAATTEAVPSRITNLNNMDNDDRNDVDERDRVEDSRETSNNGMSSGSFTRYVTQPGDTLADVIARSDADWEVFLENNAMDRIHLLPGISYLVFEETE